MPDDWFSTLLDESFRMGAAASVIFVGLFLGGLFLANLKWPMFISYRVHKERLEAETKRADKAEKDAAEDHAEQLVESADRIRQMSEDHGRVLDVQTKVLESKDRDIESWRQAYHLEAAGNDAEESARWQRIEAALVVVQRFVTEVQRHAPRSLEPGSDGSGGSHVG